MFLGESERFGSAEQEEFANVLYWGTVGPITFFNEFLNPMAFLFCLPSFGTKKKKKN